MAINFNTRPYIVLNGKDSRSIKGLIISVLPPIAKPLLRTLVEEIDGRDGDIVTPLGYAAYDKELEIGLSYGYDIDDIISFFTGSGKVVFGSEPDKYYNYAIYNQIDFEKLVRFRKATVVFHVQPFKYSDSESEKTFLFDPAETEGSLSIRDNGNILSRPKITITGAGTIGLSINEVDILSIDLPDTGDTIVIDAKEMNATNLSGSTLLNRLVTGNYDNVLLKAGKNVIGYTGSVSEIRVDNYSRWI